MVQFHLELLHVGKLFPLTPGRTYTIGRVPILPTYQPPDIGLPSVTVERRHCEVWVHDGAVWVRDLDSRSGIKINDMRVVGSPIILQSDEVLKVGPVELRLSATAQLDDRWLAWNDCTVKRIAEAIRNESAFDSLPILADALEDAGCDNADILNHCRQPGVHVRGCWVVDLLLGKE